MRKLTVQFQPRRAADLDVSKVCGAMLKIAIEGLRRNPARWFVDAVPAAPPLVSRSLRCDLQKASGLRPQGSGLDQAEGHQSSGLRPRPALIPEA